MCVVLRKKERKEEKRNRGQAETKTKALFGIIRIHPSSDSGHFSPGLLKISTRLKANTEGGGEMKGSRKVTRGESS